MRIWLAAHSQGTPGPRLIGLMLVVVERIREGGAAVGGEKWGKRLGSLLLQSGAVFN